MEKEDESKGGSSEQSSQHKGKVSIVWVWGREAEEENENNCQQ